MALPPRDQRHQYFRFEGLQYTDDDIADFEMRLGKIYMREDANGAQGCLGTGFGEVVVDLDMAGALQFQLGGVRHRMSWRQISNKGDLSAYWSEISSNKDFLGTPPSYTLIRDSMMRLCHGLIACSIARRSQAPKKVTVTDLFYLRGMDIGSVNIPYLLAMYLRLQICKELDDMWAWVALGPERQPNAAAGALEAAKDAPAVNEGALADPAPMQAP
ncbi:hypothetical protein Tco_0410442 [Tanacetum coccineum]